MQPTSGHPQSATTASQVLDSSPKPTTAVAQAPVTQADQPKPAAGEDRVSGKLQVLIQREKAALDRERAAKAKEAEISARIARLEEFENVKKTNPRRALELLGMSYQELTQAELNDGQVTPDLKVRHVEEKFDSYVQAQEAAKRQEAEKAKQDEERQATQTIEKFKGEISGYLKENSTRYELIAFEQSEELVYDVIDEHYNRTMEEAVAKAREEDAEADISGLRGEVLTIAQAADKIELHLEQKYQKARDLKKVSAFMKALPKPPQPAPAKPTNPTSHALKTLNNNLSAAPAQPQKRPRTDDDRIAAAIAYARGLRTPA